VRLILKNLGMLKAMMFHPGLPRRQTTDFTPGYIAERVCRASRPTWGIASLRQTTDLTPGYIAERSAVGPRWHDAVAYTIV
jgi:hypothetical protein